MSKILLVDTNIASAPIYEYLVQNGCDVHVVGGNPNDFLAKTAKNYINMDYSNVDELLGLIEQLDVDFLVPGCNDQSYKVCSEINSLRPFHGIDSIATTDTINHKEKFRKFASEVGLPVPKVYDHKYEEIDKTVIVKPVDAFSGRGMTVIHPGSIQCIEEAMQKAESFSRTKTCIVEDYITGQLYSHSAFVRRHEIITDFIVEEHGTANPFVVDTSRVIYDFPPSLLEKIRADIRKMAKLLQLKDGLIHSQFIRTEDDYWLVEVTRRCPGDLYSQLIELSTGFKYAESYAAPFLGKSVTATPHDDEKSWILRHTISTPKDIRFAGIRFMKSIEMKKFIPLATAGDIIKASPFGRIGLLFAQTSTKSEQDVLMSEMLNRNIYEI